MSRRIATVFGCVGALVTLGLLESTTAFTSTGDNPSANLFSRLRTDRGNDYGTELSQPRSSRTEIATLSTLPALDGAGPSEALAVDEAGTVIVGYSWDRSKVLHAVKWTRQTGSWAISSLPDEASPTCGIARGVNNEGDAAGYDLSSPASQAVLWAATGGVTVLGCAEGGTARVYGISAGSQILVGQQDGAAAVWQPGSCRVDLPRLIETGYATAMAVNRDGMIVGGVAAISSSSGVPVRWRSVAGQWQIEQLDSRPGLALGANAAGDLAGYVSIPCALGSGCQRAVIWYAAGGSRTLDTLGGEHSWARDINASGEVVGGSTSPRVGNTGFFWSESLGMFQLPVKGGWAAANAVSNVRPDGTRLVVGMDAQGRGVVWVVRNP